MVKYWPNSNTFGLLHLLFLRVSSRNLYQATTWDRPSTRSCRYSRHFSPLNSSNLIRTQASPSTTTPPHNRHVTTTEDHCTRWAVQRHLRNAPVHHSRRRHATHQQRTIHSANSNSNIILGGLPITTTTAWSTTAIGAEARRAEARATWSRT